MMAHTTRFPHPFPLCPNGCNLWRVINYMPPIPPRSAAVILRGSCVGILSYDARFDSRYGYYIFYIPPTPLFLHPFPLCLQKLRGYTQGRLGHTFFCLCFRIILIQSQTKFVCFFAWQTSLNRCNQGVPSPPNEQPLHLKTIYSLCFYFFFLQLVLHTMLLHLIEINIF